MTKYTFIIYRNGCRIGRSKACIKKRYNENYDLFMKKYGEAVWGYKVPEVTEPEQPETRQGGNEQLSALVSKIYGARPFGGMGVDEAGHPATRAWVRTACGRGLFWYLGTDDIKFEAGVASELQRLPRRHIPSLFCALRMKSRPQTRRLSSRPRLTRASWDLRRR